ncbi:hypothetical protein I5M27_09970 [Adhaeribacter sp. BT258]|uniref:Tetratricopeptide repeat-containing protein n=1 Tax=Adhaeribacter terrigena TaxID=2793070 RepID=A0ABS1C1W7_9BACT|nr:hypothetical protein [Adhaeribacter terrigena]MBK0403313.1 hypothetical protein [Adhaeribacter terrigena]
MAARYFFLFFLLLSGFAGQAQYQHLLHKTYAQRYLALEKTFYNSKYLGRDSVYLFGELEKVQEAALQADDEELQLETQMLRCEYYLFGKQINHRLFEVQMLALRALADQKGIGHLQVRTRQKLGYFYFSAKHKYGPGFENYLQSYQFMKKVPEKELPDKQEMIANIGSAYYKFGDNMNARKFLTEAFQAAPSYKKRLPIHLTNTLGLIYREEHKFDSAAFYLWKTYRMAEKLHDSTWMGIAAGNIGINFYLQKKYDEAIPLLKIDVRESIKAHEFDNAATSLIILSKISLQKNNLPEAQAQIRQVKAMLPKTSDLYKHLREIYPLLARLSATKGDSARAYLYADSAHFVKDSLYARRRTMMTTMAERKIELEKHRAEMQRLEAQDALQATLRNSLIMGIVLLLIIAALVINRQRILHRQKEQQLQNEKEVIESELETATRQLRDFTNHIREKNKLIEQFSTEIEKHKDQADAPELEASKEARDKLMQATILTDDQWEEFRHVFDKVHGGYLLRLREKLPVLSPADTRYIVLSKLNLTSKEMASMLGVRPDAIRLYRHRLRKKLSITDDKELEQLIKSI